MMKTFIQILSQFLSRFASRWIPDPLVISMCLSVGVLLWSILGSDLGFWATIDAWGGRLDQGKVLPSEKGLWKLLAFAMQMCLVLVTGYALATAPFAQLSENHLAQIIPKNKHLRKTMEPREIDEHI